MSNTLDKLERHQEALDCYTKALELKPDYAKAWYNMGNTLDKLERHQEAKECFEKAKKLSEK